MTQTSEQRAEVQQWASKVQLLESQLDKARSELSVAYDLINSYVIENDHLRRTFKHTFDEVIETCDNLLKGLKT